MLLAKIDATSYPVVHVKSPNRITIPSHAMRVLEFEPGRPNDQFLIYFKEDENEDEKFLNTFTRCRDVDLLEPGIGVETRRIEGRWRSGRNFQEVDRRLESIKPKDKGIC